MPTKTAKDYKKDYTKPELREQLKENIKQENKGGKSGEWSARKSQLLVKEYKKQGGSYNNAGKKTSAQKSLTQWTTEDWQTVDNKAAIRDGETVRYLPKPERFELPTPWFVARYSIQLSYGRVL